ncbi:MAG TPA: HAD family hydrolase [Kineosporiaceae bacterium]|nr:HAD family hydrolase [Kineosporiaceae bacterium]
MIRGVLLDVDDTLVDTRAAFAAGIAHVVRRWLPHLDREGRQGALRHWVTDAEGHFRAYTQGRIDLVEQRRRRVAALHAAFGGPAVDAELFEAWDAAFEDAYRAAWRPCPDAPRLLDTLDAVGLARGVVTNMRIDYQREKLAVVGLLDRVGVLVGMETFGVGKPDPRLFRHACDVLGVEPAEAAYVGDELEVDARGARDAGLLGVWLDRHGTGESPPDVPVISSLDELPAVLGVDRGGSEAR